VFQHHGETLSAESSSKFVEITVRYTLERTS